MPYCTCPAPLPGIAVGPDGGARGRPRLRDYVAWHEAYDDPGSALSVRLRHVQRAIGAAYDRMPGAVRVLSSCAGQGADILGVLEARPELRDRTTGALLELLEDNCAVARARIRDLGAELEVRRVDASVTDAYFGAVPADLVLLVGIMGNIPASDVERLARVLRAGRHGHLDSRRPGARPGAGYRPVVRRGGLRTPGPPRAPGGHGHAGGRRAPGRRARAPAGRGPPVHLPPLKGRAEGQSAGL